MTKPFYSGSYEERNAASAALLKEVLHHFGSDLSIEVADYGQEIHVSPANAKAFMVMNHTDDTPENLANRIKEKLNV